MTTLPETYLEEGFRVSDFYEPHEGQLKVHASPAKSKVLTVGRRWGKSRCAFGDLFSQYMKALHIPVPATHVPPFHAWIVVPSKPQGRQTWHELKQLFPAQLVERVVEEDYVIYLKGSEARPWGLIEVKSAYNPASLQTVGIDYLWLNEAHDIQEEAWEKLVPILRSPDRLGYLMMEGIPPLLTDHFFRRAYLYAQAGHRDWFAYTATSFENPYLTDAQKKEIEEDRELLREAAWRRMYLAEFSESAGYFGDIYRLIAGEMRTGPMAGRRYVGGLDVGRKVDPTVLYILDMASRQVVYWRIWDAGQDYTLIREGVSQECNAWALDRIIADATGVGDVFIANLIEAGIKVEEFIFTQQSRYDLLNDLAVAIERETLHYPNNPMLLRQLAAFQAVKRGDRYRAEVPRGEHDDHVFALALGLRGCNPPDYNRARTATVGVGRYLPTQNEALSGIRGGLGQRLMAQRASDRRAQRWFEAGILTADGTLGGVEIP
jgi:hypothetical protein